MHVLHELVPRGPLLLQAECMLDFNKLKRGRTNNIVFYTFTGMLLSALQLVLVQIDYTTKTQRSQACCCKYGCAL